MVALNIEIGGTLEQAKYAYNFYMNSSKEAASFCLVEEELKYIEKQIELWTKTNNCPADIYTEGFAKVSKTLGVIDRSIIWTICGSKSLAKTIAAVIHNSSKVYFYMHGYWFYTFDTDAKYIVQMDEAYTLGKNTSLCVNCRAPIMKMVTSNGAECVLIEPDYKDYTQGSYGHIFGIHRCKSIFTLNDNRDLVYKDLFKITYTSDASNRYIIAPPESMHELSLDSMFYFPKVYTQFGNYYMVDALFSPSGTKIILGDIEICTFQDGQYSSSTGPAIDYTLRVIKQTLNPGELYFSQHQNLYRNTNSRPIEEIEIYEIEGRHFVAADGLVMVSRSAAQFSLCMIGAAFSILFAAIVNSC